MAGIVKSSKPNAPRIIKTVSRDGDANQAAGRANVTEFNLSDLAEQGREQLQRCQRQVEAMLEEARQQSEHIKTGAHAAGYAEGWQAAENEIEAHVDSQAERKAKTHVESLHAAVVQMTQQYDDWMQQYADALTTTAIAAAEQLTRAKLTLPAGGVQTETAEHLIVRWAREALHCTRSANRLTLAVHPDTLAQLGPALHALLAHSDLTENSEVIANETLRVGDIVVRQDGGEIHAGLDAQLQRLGEQLR